MSHTVSKTCTNQYQYDRCSSQLLVLTSQDLNRTSTFSEVLDRKRFGCKYDCPIITNLLKSSSFEDNAIILELQDFRLALNINTLLWVKLDIHVNIAKSDALFTYMFVFFLNHVRVNLEYMTCSFPPKKGNHFNTDCDTEYHACSFLSYMNSKTD